FNPGYLLDGLGVLDAPTALLSFTTPKKPVVVTPADQDGKATVDYKYLLMPMRLPDQGAAEAAVPRESHG
ncbi:MAG: hypothetical protein J2P14_09240, partial [Acidothermales bacterium]|nr:hypothetical protein [Acidothermales bacterium]